MTDSLPDDQKEALAGQIPMGRLGTTDEVAQVVLFLAGESGSYITGQTIHVNGGIEIIGAGQGFTTPPYPDVGSLEARGEFFYYLSFMVVVLTFITVLSLIHISEPTRPY